MLRVQLRGDLDGELLWLKSDWKVSMPAQKAELTEFTVGHYVCPKTKLLVPLKASCSLAYLNWPVVVEQCPNCGGKHVLCCEDVQHPPVFGYE